MAEYREIRIPGTGTRWSNGDGKDVWTDYDVWQECQRCGALVTNTDMHDEDHGERDAHRSYAKHRA